MKPFLLAFVEGAAVFSGVTAMTALWRPGGVDNVHLAAEILLQALVLSICCIVAFYYNDLYDLYIVRDFEMFLLRLVESLGVTFILTAFSYMLLPETNMANGPFVSSVLIIVGVLIPLRAAMYTIMRRQAFCSRVVIVGANDLVAGLISETRNRPNAGLSILGVVDDRASGEAAIFGVPVLGPIAEISRVLTECRPDRIVVALSERRGRLPVRALLEAKARGARIEEATQVYENLTGKMALESLMPSALIFDSGYWKSRVDLAIGRLTSMIVSVAGLLVTTPLMALIAVVIKADSPGPALFLQDRIGRHGQAFRLIKFRTMRVAAGPHSEWVKQNQDRITRVGHWLRTFRLDELPQFINILRGDMNLVGPRPHPVANLALFREHIPYYSIRCSVRPGVTGWAQIRYGYANSLDEEIEKMRYDLFYIKRMSPLFDLRILFDSVKTVMFGRGAQSAELYDKQVGEQVAKAS
jgi:exopolysaccharide biosynthesis polyprenyl glycosylphosphotransferase